MPAKLAAADQMTIDEFLAFTDQRPDGERWELIEGVAIMNASPTDWHQTICLNIAGELRTIKASTGATWTPLLDIGTRVPASPRSLPRPDVIVKEGPLTGKSVSDDAGVLIEVLSKSNSKIDLAWRARVYQSIPNCRHYVTVSMKAAEVVRHDRDGAWKTVAFSGLDAVLELPWLGVRLPLRTIYRWTPIA
jgi:Uma2 family endonuclease